MLIVVLKITFIEAFINSMHKRYLRIFGQGVRKFVQVTSYTVL